MSVQLGMRSVLTPILMYHQVAPREWAYFDSHITVESSKFKKQIETLLSMGWDFVTQRELVDESDFQLKPDLRNKMVLTFDDVSRCFLDYALPVLLELGVRATLFPIGNTLLNKSVQNLQAQSLSWLSAAELKHLSDLGFEIGSHAMSHQNLLTLSSSELRYELESSKRILEEICAKPVVSFCYPMGYFDDAVVQEVKSAGYRSACTILRGNRQTLNAPFTLTRISAGDRHLGWKLRWITSPFYGTKKYLKRRLLSTGVQHEN